LDIVVDHYDEESNSLSVTRGGTTWTYSYNALNAMTQVKLIIDARTYQFDYGYKRPRMRRSGA
jgi:YD repeat-containing protein